MKSKDLSDLVLDFLVNRFQNLQGIKTCKKYSCFGFYFKFQLTWWLLADFPGSENVTSKTQVYPEITPFLLDQGWRIGAYVILRSL